MIDQHDKSDWRQVMLTQYGIFGTIAGLEVASLSIYAALSNVPITTIQRFLFTVTSLSLLGEVPMILWLINQERKVAFNEADMMWFKKNERTFRNFLIILMTTGWVAIVCLLMSAVLFQ